MELFTHNLTLETGDLVWGQFNTWNIENENWDGPALTPLVDFYQRNFQKITEQG